ncbi:F0F1 ATP synthase subunit A [Streptococcus entericus]|uniref:F0F1 ATP synthase subunit A n=1 Tax=Streptococcus entericus TaxID=155680 RepID=UPI0003729D84|nr:F0F1 ATP synthase subunit A [Streptococcus entericus]
MGTHDSPTLTLGPVSFDLVLLTMSLVIVVAIFGWVFWSSRQMQLRPTGKQNLLEYCYEFVFNIAEKNLGPVYSRQYSLLLFTVFTFLALANNIGLLTKVQTSHGTNFVTSPTANIYYDLGLAVLMTIIIHVEAIRQRGLKAYLKEFVTPPAMTPMNILEEVTNVASLALRLYGNIFAGEVVMDLILMLGDAHLALWPVAILLNMLWTAFSVFISFIQAYVFTLLVSIYLGKKLNS